VFPGKRHAIKHFVQVVSVLPINVSVLKIRSERPARKASPLNHLFKALRYRRFAFQNLQIA
jgi:hypothetical protein